MIRSACALALLVLCLLSPGCISRIGGSMSTDEALNKLRSENTDLRSEVEQLKRNIDNRVAEIDHLKQRLAATRPAGTNPADQPTVNALRFDRYTAAIDTNHDGVDDLVRVYLQPADQKDRFLPAVGKAVLQVVAIPAGGPPRQLAEKTYSPKEFDAAYRSGFTGTHYTLEVPLPRDLPADLKEVTVKVTFTDSATGVTLSQQQVLPVRTKAAK